MLTFTGPSHSDATRWELSIAALEQEVGAI
jgi:hypothetical protein